MGLFSNLKMQQKLGLSVGLIVTFALAIEGTALLSLRNTDNRYTNLLDFPQKRLETIMTVDKDISELRRHVEAFVFETDPEDIEDVNKEVAALMTKIDGSLDKYVKLVSDDTALSSIEQTDRLSKLNTLRLDVEAYKQQVAEIVYDMAKEGKNSEISAVIIDSADKTDSLAASIEDLVTAAQTLTSTSSQAVTDKNQYFFMLFIIAIIVQTILTITIIVYLSGSLSGRLNRLVFAAQRLVSGDTKVVLDTKPTDEIGTLAKSFANVAANIDKIISEIYKMSRSHDRGEMSYRINTIEFPGSYRDMSYGINKMVESYINMLEDIFQALKSLGSGNLEITMVKYRGEKEVANREIGNLQAAISKTVEEIEAIVKACVAGNLADRVELGQHTGKWEEIFIELNKLMDAVSVPLNDVRVIMGKVAGGNLDVSLGADYPGSFGILAKDINNTVTSVNHIIEVVENTLGSMSKGDLTVKITEEFPGKYKVIKAAINRIIDALNVTLKEIDTVSTNVLSSAEAMSHSAEILATGASEQASSIEELNASIETINAETIKNADNASKANQLSERSTANANIGNDEMKNMLKAMDGIKEASNNISQIIQVIDDIAFQTNLLALNASVEAARAGDNGKGFAVVAEEVRNLAGRSQSAARETTALIEDSISRVNEGTRIAEQTASALSTIVKNAKDVSDVIGEILKATNEQANAISNISSGVEQISGVVQSNSATAEETSAASEELNNQSMMMKQRVEFFKLKR